MLCNIYLKCLTTDVKRFKCSNYCPAGIGLEKYNQSDNIALCIAVEMECMQKEYGSVNKSI